MLSFPYLIKSRLHGVRHNRWILRSRNGVPGQLNEVDRGVVLGSKSRGLAMLFCSSVTTSYFDANRQARQAFATFSKIPDPDKKRKSCLTSRQLWRAAEQKRAT